MSETELIEKVNTHERLRYPNNKNYHNRHQREPRVYRLKTEHGECRNGTGHKSQVHKEQPMQTRPKGTSFDSCVIGGMFFFRRMELQSFFAATECTSTAEHRQFHGMTAI